MDEHQYFILVLANNNSSYVYMNNLRSVVVTDTSIADFGGLRYYRVILPKIDRTVPLPSNLQTWTTIAYVVWDDIDPALLTCEPTNIASQKVIEACGGRLAGDEVDFAAALAYAYDDDARAALASPHLRFWLPTR